LFSTRLHEDDLLDANEDDFHSVCLALKARPERALPASGLPLQLPLRVHSLWGAPLHLVWQPVRPDEYIRLRLRPFLAFYRNRIPSYARKRITMRITLFMCAAAGSTIAYVASKGELSSQWAVLVTSAAACLTSWMEFTELGLKCERYTRAVVDIQNILSAWKSLSDVEKSSARRSVSCTS